jgi:ATP-dependent RNA helicase UAP56/SUB2
MSAHDNEELVAYEDDEDLVATTGGSGAQNGGAEKDKKYAGIHSTGFR